MAVLDDISTVVNAVDKLSTNGLPIKLEHEVDSTSIFQLGVMLVVVAAVLALLLGVKDVVVNRIIR